MNKKIIKIISIIGIIISVTLIYFAFKDNIFSDPKELQSIIKKFGDFGIFIFILIQVIQPVIPIIPGGLSDIAGILMYGNYLGLFYVSIGLIIGEIILFYLVRSYGQKLLIKIVSDKSMKTIKRFTKSSSIQKLIILIFLMPFGPDDLVCIAAGLSDMSFKKYFWTITILKPISVGVHCFIMIHILKVV